MRPLATLIAVILFVATLPAFTLCCVDQPICTTTMQASMPCCAGSCTMSRPGRVHDNDVTLTAAPSLKIDTGAVAIVAAVPVKVSIVMASNDHQADGFSPPPPILLNEQFRI